MACIFWGGAASAPALRGRRVAVAGAFGVAPKAPGTRLRRDAPPHGTLVRGRQFQPALHFGKTAPAAFAFFVALAGGADGNAGRVGLGVVPGQPGLQGGGGQLGRVNARRALPYQGAVHLGQGAHGRRQHAMVGGLAGAPVVDGGFDVGDVDGDRHAQGPYGNTAKGLNQGRAGDDRRAGMACANVVQ